MFLVFLAFLAQIQGQTTVDYARAEKFLGPNTSPLVLHSGVHPTWMPDDRFWYRTTTENGPEAILIDPGRDTRSTFTPPLTTDEMPDSVVSPDGKRAVFIRDYNLWVRDVATRKERQLTRDGVKDFGYATDNAGWIRSDTPVVK